MCLSISTPILMKIYKLDCMPQKLPYPKKWTRLWTSVKADIFRPALPEKHSPTYCSEHTATWWNGWFAILPVVATRAHLTASNSLEFGRAIRPSERGAQRTLGLLIKVLQRMKEAKVTRNSNYLTPVTQKNILRKDSKYTVEELPITETEKNTI